MTVTKKFSVLFGKAFQSLRVKNIPPNELVIKFTPEIKLFSKEKNLDEIFKSENNWCSFFDYEVLEVIILTHCSELKDEVEEYIADFKAYCNRRIFEAPTKFTATSNTKFILRVKLDKEFNAITVNQLKELEIRLKNLIKLHLNLLRFENGCIVLAFESLNEEDDMLPFTDEVRKELFEMYVLKLYSDSKVYFDHDKYEPQEIKHTTEHEKHGSISKSWLHRYNRCVPVHKSYRSNWFLYRCQLQSIASYSYPNNYVYTFVTRPNVNLQGYTLLINYSYHQLHLLLTLSACARVTVLICLSVYMCVCVCVCHLRLWRLS